MKFANWLPEVHDLESQKGRMISAASAEQTPLELDYILGTANFSGHHGVYHTTISTCTCRDFEVNHLPCKHIYRLAHELHLIDLGDAVVNDKRNIIRPDAIVEAERMRQAADNPSFAGKTFVLTGDFSSFTRKEAVEWLKKRGANVLGSITSKTDFLVVGQNAPDGKLRRAQAMNIPVLAEQDLLDMINEK